MRRRIIWGALAALLLLAGCAQQPEPQDNLEFTATVQELADGSILVTTADPVGFDRAWVGLAGVQELPHNLLAGQQVIIEALPQIQESDPVQIEAVKITMFAEEVKGSYQRITPQEAMDRMEEDGVLILDVRTQEEYDQGYIPGAVLLPDDQLAQKAPELLPDRGQTILVYCRSGRRSAGAAKALVDLGYTQVYDFGGILDWPGEVVR